MANLGSLLYWLPRTEFTIAAERLEKVTAEPKGSYLRPAVGVKVSHCVVADRVRGQCRLQVDAGFLETVDVSVTLDDQGIITAVNSESATSYAPIIDLAAKALPIVLTLGGLAIAKAGGKAKDRKPESLEKQWADKNVVLAGRLKQLLEQADRLFKALVDLKSNVQHIAAVGPALDVVQGQIADIVEARRFWMALQETSVEKTLRLSPCDLVKVDSLEPSRKIDSIEGPQASLAKDIKCFLAIEDPSRPEKGKASEGGAAAEVDHISVRQPRPVRIGVYKSSKTKGIWTLDQQSVQALDVVDDLCAETSISLDRNGLKLAFHPDMSLKTFGVKKGSSAPAIATSLGGVLDAVAAARSKAAKEEAPEKKDFKIELVVSGQPDELLSIVRHRSSALI